MGDDRAGAVVISALHLDVSNPDASIAFYVDQLGMQLAESRTEQGIHAVAFPSDASATQLHLHHRPDASAYSPKDNDAYWKIGVTLSDVDSERERLRQNGIEVTEPIQFHDIGYLCHLDDPDGYTIELLQHTFEDSPPAQGADRTLGQISLRVRDIDASLAFYRDELGMSLLSRQRVESRGFTLYFLAFTDESPPDPDIDAVSNREWLWQRPYTALELRHEPNAQKRIPHPPDSELGFRGISIAGVPNGGLRDPDGVLLRLST